MRHVVFPIKKDVPSTPFQTIRCGCNEAHIGMNPLETYPPYISPQWGETCVDSSFLEGIGPFNPDPPEEAALPTTATHHPHHPQEGEQLRQHTGEEWTAMYPLIKRLYMTEHRRLREVVQILKRNHGFNATYVLRVPYTTCPNSIIANSGYASSRPRMYKIRLARWGFFKNNSKKRAAASSKVARPGTQDVEVSDEPGDAGANLGTVFVDDANPPETARESCEARRSRSSSTENEIMQCVFRQAAKRKYACENTRDSDSSETRPEPEVDEILDMSMACAAIPRRPTDTPRERRALSIFHGVASMWERPKATTGWWGEHPRHRPPPTVPDAFASTEMYRSFGLAATLWSRGQGRLAGKAIRRAFILAEEALAPSASALGNRAAGYGYGGDAMLMWNVVDVVNEMCHWGQGRLLRLFLEHLKNMAACRAPRHPVRGVARELLVAVRSGVNGGGGGDELSEVAERAWRCNLDRVRAQFEAEEEQVRRLVESVSTAEAKQGHDGAGRPSDGVIARGIMEWVRSAELLRRSITPRNPYNPQPGQTRYETRVWYMTVAAYATWSAASSSAVEDKISASMRDPQDFAPGNQQDYDDARRRAILDIYVRKARLRALVDAQEFDIAQPLAEGVLRFTDMDRPTTAPHADDHQIRAIVARWAFQELLERSGKMAEARLVRDDNMRRVERFLAAIPDELP